MGFARVIDMVFDIMHRNLPESLGLRFILLIQSFNPIAFPVTFPSLHLFYYHSGMRSRGWSSIRNLPALQTSLHLCSQLTCIKYMSMWVLRIRFGAPISRRRIYIFLIRKELMTEEAMSQDIGEFLQNQLKKMHHKADCSWPHRCI